MLKAKLVANAIILALLFSLVLQVTMFGISISNKKFSGTVYAATGVPVSGAIVSAHGDNGAGGTTTDASGNYTINSGLPNGTYKVSVYKQGYLVAEIDNVNVTVGIVTTGINLYLNLSGAILGKVSDNTTGNGLSGIFVAATLSDDSGTYGSEATTDAQGNYEMNTDLGTGTYNVTVYLPTGYFQMTVSPVSVTAGTKITGVNLSLHRSGIISGHITTPLGVPIANVTVVATNAGFTYLGTNTTDATGAYRIESGLGTDNYTVSALSGLDFNSTSAMVTAGQETPNVDMQLPVIAPPPSFSGTIKGKVTDTSNTPIEGANVQAIGNTHFAFGSATTASDGTYTISKGLSSTDTYNVTASASGYVSQSNSSVNVAVNQTTSNVNLQLTQIPPSQSGSISGTVMGDANPIPEFQYPIVVMLFITLVTVAIARSRKPKTKYP
jgi:hypothetical protein